MGTRSDNGWGGSPRKQTKFEVFFDYAYFSVIGFVLLALFVAVVASLLGF